MLGSGFWRWEGRLYSEVRCGFDYGMRQRFDSTNLMLHFVFLTNLLDGPEEWRDGSQAMVQEKRIAVSAGW